MTEIPFHATPMGRRYYEATLPSLVGELARINATLVDLVEVLDRNGKPRWERQASVLEDAPEEHGSHGASSLNPNP